jgi:hypothetical protein
MEGVDNYFSLCVSTTKWQFLRVKKEFLPRRSFLSIEFFLDRRGDPVDLANSRGTFSGTLHFSIGIEEKKQP